jgi:alpha-D-ribose 1-methylphosphonate 5-triphosphate synthase subunit PhnH
MAAVTGPAPTAEELDERDTFLALMWALSYPGRVTRMARGIAGARESLVACGRALLDLETSYYAADDALEVAFSRSGARHVPVADAQFVFFSQLAEADLPLVEMARGGRIDYPDEAATVLVACDLDAPAGSLWSLRGPGVASAQTMRLAGIPDGFFTVRERKLRYPLGIDVFLVGAGAVIGLPRTTTVTPCM